MLRAEIIEKLYDIVDETTMMISAEEGIGYLHALNASCQNILNDQVNSKVEAQTIEALKKHYSQIEGLGFSQEEIRKALQLAILKGLKADRVTNAAMTPDSIAMITGYLFSKFMKSIEKLAIADLTVGTGNFLTAVLNHLETPPAKVYGVDVSEDLLQVAYTLADMQEHEIQFYQQSSLKSMMIEPLDAIISDLPADGLENSDLSGADLSLAKQGSNYLPYLLMENHLRYLKPGGYGFYVIPNDLFSQAHNKEFHTLLTKEAEIQALLQLPDTLFKSGDLGKSIFVIQKKGGQSTPVKEVLAARLPSFSDHGKLTGMLGRIDAWIAANK